MRKSSILLLVLVLFSCKEKQQKKAVITRNIPAQYEMYQTSEMASLMREMVEEHTILKEKIQKEKDIGTFNKAYLKLHTATMTDPRDRDVSFEAFSKSFIQMQKKIFEVPISKRKEVYNNVINLCVGCHQDHCGGPIPRIKKLLIP